MLLRRKPLFIALAAGLVLVTAAAWAEREFRVYRSFEEHADHTDLPPDWNKPAGFVVARLMYPVELRRLWPLPRLRWRLALRRHHLGGGLSRGATASTPASCGD